jgi:MOSC domain-containing protein YiiM
MAAADIYIRSLHIGRPVTVEHNGRQVRTAYFKEPVSGPVFLGRLGFDGDHQANRKYHGGPDKAVLAYATDHYPYWESVFGRPIGTAAFGENLLIAGLTEATACIGDQYRIGEAVVQVTQPRIPCHMTNIRHGVTDMPQRMIETGYTGFYLRVLSEGWVAPGDAVVLLHRPAGAPTVAHAHHVWHRGRQDREAMERLLSAEGLAQGWKESLEARLRALAEG